jgi:hypothetical protein
MRGMGVFLRIAIRMMHPVEDGIRARIQKGRTLRNESKEVKEAFPKFIHPKHLVGSITVEEERLRK